MVGEFSRKRESRNSSLQNFALCFSADGSMLCAAGDEGFAIWRLDTKKVIASYQDHSCRISGMHFVGNTYDLVAFEHSVLEGKEVSEKQMWTRWTLLNGAVERTHSLLRPCAIAAIAKGGERICYVDPAVPKKMYVVDVVWDDRTAQRK